MQKPQEMQVHCLSWEDPLEKEMATQSSILAWRIPWTEEPVRLQSMRSQSQTWLNMQAHRREPKGSVCLAPASTDCKSGVRCGQTNMPRACALSHSTLAPCWAHTRCSATFFVPVFLRHCCCGGKAQARALVKGGGRWDKECGFQLVAGSSEDAEKGWGAVWLPHQTRPSYTTL